MKVKFLAIVLSVFLTSCVGVDFGKLSKDEIKALSYQDLCNPYSTKNELAFAEMKRRGIICDIIIDNCKLTHKLNPKSPAFAQCVNNYRQAEQIRQQMALNQMQQGIAKIEESRRPIRPINSVTTNCQPNFVGGFSCRSY